jgi:PAS domain S-box-containing protein
MNTAFEKAVDATNVDWKGKPFLQLPNLPKSSKKILIENLQKRSQGFHVEPYEVDVVTLDGEVRQYEINAKVIDFAGKPAVLVVCRDVTQRKKYELQLKGHAENLEVLVEKKTSEIKENEEKLRGIFDSSPDGIIVVKPDGIISECNQALVNMLGYSSKGEVIGKEGQGVISPKDYKKVIDLMAKALKQGEEAVRNVECFFVTKDGAEVACEFSVSITRESTGEMAAYVGITKDITERKRMEQSLKEDEEKQRGIRQELSEDKGQAKPQWYVNGQGQTMVVIPGPVEFLIDRKSTRLNSSH